MDILSALVISAGAVLLISASIVAIVTSLATGLVVVGHWLKTLISRRQGGT